MKITVQDGTKKTYDFDRYREMFGERGIDMLTYAWNRAGV